MNIFKKVFSSRGKTIIPPSFIILGAQKSGTTALFNLLGQHPNIYGPPIKEVRYFIHDHLYNKGHNWYHNHFKSTSNIISNPQITFEASPGYLYYPHVPKRFFEYNPNLKFIIILRDPISRAFSAWNMYRKMHQNPPRVVSDWIKKTNQPEHIEQFLNVFFRPKSPPSFDYIVNFELGNISNIEHPCILRYGIYVEQIKNYFNFFHPAQFLILEDKMLAENTQKTLDNICQFINLPSHNYDKNSLKTKYNKNEYDTQISKTTLNKLAKFYAPYNKELTDFLKIKFYWV